jgi:hypothetical protein
VEQEPIRHLLYVRWFGGQGQTKLNKLPLKQIDTLEALEVGWHLGSCSAAHYATGRSRTGPCLLWNQVWPDSGSKQLP